MINDRITKAAFLISLLGHCLFLGMPLFNIELFQAKQPKDITMKVEIERPQLLPKIEQLGEEKKLKKIEEVGKKPEPEPQIAEETQEYLEPKPEEIALLKEPHQPINEENIEILKPDDEAMFRYQDMVKQKIESCRRYPNWAKKQELEGISYIVFTLLSSGMVKDVKLIRSSGFDILDKEAISTVKRASPFKPIPGKFNCSSLTMEVALVFKLK